MAAMINEALSDTLKQLHFIFLLDVFGHISISFFHLKSNYAAFTERVATHVNYKCLYVYIVQFNSRACRKVSHKVVQ